jgi:hypothetical protein
MAGAATRSATANSRTSLTLHCEFSQLARPSVVGQGLFILSLEGPLPALTPTQFGPRD